VVKHSPDRLHEPNPGWVQTRLPPEAWGRVRVVTVG